MSLSLESPLRQVKGIGEKYAQLLSQKKRETVLDLLLHFPLFYIDFSSAGEGISPGEVAAYRMRIASVKLSRNFARRFSVLRAAGRIGETPVEAVFFNKPYLADPLKNGEEILVYGKCEDKNGGWQMLNPMVFLPGQAGEIVPVYASLGALKSGQLRKIIGNILAELQDDSDTLPEFLRARHRFPGRAEALRWIHRPEKGRLHMAERAKKRFSYGELLFFQLELQFIRSRFRNQKRAHPYRFTPAIREAIARDLPFTLTGDQVRAFDEIVNDLMSPCNMQRLLQGEVGSGKTILAFLTLLVAAKNGYQGALLAPTEILAAQHYAAARAFFGDEPVTLLTGSTAIAEKREIEAKLQRGEIGILFGTHSLLGENIRFRKLALIVIDEQQRFGVSQRAALYFKGRSVDMLVMTATPIPRTMLLGLYSDLAVSSLRSGPAGRKSIRTRIIEPDRRDSFYSWIRRRIENGEKGYIVLPLIEPSDHFSQLRSIAGEESYFRNVFRGIPLGIITGGKSPEQKNSLMEKFKAGAIRLVIATTVIEVGIDVTDATLIVIENADRYGLAQLHQMRGRVGRGDRQSHCYLLPSEKITENGKLRLQTLARTGDGFKIAEMDLKMRGGGLITGQEQWGAFDFRIADTERDFLILRAAERDAGLLLEKRELRGDGIRSFLDSLEKKIETISFS